MVDMSIVFVQWMYDPCIFRWRDSICINGLSPVGSLVEGQHMRMYDDYWRDSICVCTSCDIKAIMLKEGQHMHKIDVHG
jgi:hypothetical protein